MPLRVLTEEIISSVFCSPSLVSTPVAKDLAGRRFEVSAIA